MAETMRKACEKDPDLGGIFEPYLTEVPSCSCACGGVAHTGDGCGSRFRETTARRSDHQVKALRRPPGPRLYGGKGDARHR